MNKNFKNMSSTFISKVYNLFTASIVLFLLLAIGFLGFINFSYAADLQIDGLDGPGNYVAPASFTLSWTTLGTPNKCTASGNWSGSKNISGGTENFSGIADGSYNYRLTCLGESLPLIDPVVIGSANAADTGNGIAVLGNYAYVASSATGDDLEIFDVSNPASPFKVGGAGAGDRANDVVVSSDGQYAYVVSSSAGHDLEIFDVSNPASPFKVGGAQLVNGGGKGVAVSGQYVYAVSSVGTSANLEIFDVSNPASPVRVGNFAAAPQAQRVVVAGNYVYVASAASGVCCDSGKDLEIFDISSPTAAVRKGGAQILNFAAWDVAVSGNYAYIAGGGVGSPSANDFQIYNISNPSSPTPVGSLNMAGPLSAIRVAGDYVYITTGSGRLYVFDVSNPASPSQVSSITPAGFLIYIYDMTVFGNYVYLVDAATGDDLHVIAQRSIDSVSATVSAPPPLGEPDLVSNLAPPPSPTEGDPVTFSGDIQNIGDAPANGGWSVENASYDVSFNLNSSGEAESDQRDITFKPDGTKMYVVGVSNDTVYQYTLSVPWDVGSASYDNVSISINSAGESNGFPPSLTFKPDGKKMYVLNWGRHQVHEYILQTPWNIGIALYDPVAGFVDLDPGCSAACIGYQGITFKPDGTKMYAVYDNGNVVKQYTLSTPWNIQTASYDNASTSINTSGEGTYGNSDSGRGEDFPHDIAFKPDGTKMYMVGHDSDTVYQYTLDIAWDISTASYDNIHFFVRFQEFTPGGLALKPDGTKMYMVGNWSKSVHQYSLGGPSTARFCVGAQGSFTEEDCFNGTGSMTVILPDPSTSVLDTFGGANDTETETSSSWTAGPAGNYDIMLCADVDDVVAESLENNNCSSKQFTISAPPPSPEPDLVVLGLTVSLGIVADTFVTFDGVIKNDGDAVANASTARFCVGPTGSFTEAECFNNTGPVSMTVILSDQPTGALDALSTETETSGMWQAGPAGNYDIMLCADVGKVVTESDESLINGNCGKAPSFPVTAPPPAGEPNLITENLSSSGTLETGQTISFNGDVRNTGDADADGGWDISSAVYSGENVSVGESNTQVEGVFFKPDGTKMYVVGMGNIFTTDNDVVYQYNLSTPWNPSTANYDSISVDVTSEETATRGLFFKPDGTKMYIVGFLSDKVHQYTLSSPWDVGTASYDNASFSIVGQSNESTDLFFSSDGTKLYIINSLSIFEDNKVIQYTLSSPWDITTASYANVKFEVYNQETGPQTIFFKPDGSKMYIAGGDTNNVYQYTLSTPWNVGTASYDALSININSEDSSVSSITFKPDGLKMYMLGDVTDRVYEYNLGGPSTSRFCIDSADFNDCLVNGTGMIDEPATGALAATPGPGDSETENATWIPSAAGVYDIFFCADVGFDVAESNESANNNCSLITITVTDPIAGGEPDLITENLFPSGTLETGQTISFSGDVRNVGDVTSDGVDNWNVVFDGSNNLISSFAFDSTNNVLYAGEGTGSGEGNIYQCITTTDCDQTSDWTLSFTYPGPDSVRISALAYVSTQNVMYAGTRGGTSSIIGDIYRCDTVTLCNSSSDWTLAFDGPSGEISNIVFDTVGGVLYASQSATGGSNTDGDVYRCSISSNCDQTSDWTLSYSQVSISGQSVALGTDILSLAFDSVNRVLYAAHGDDAGEGDIYRCDTATLCDQTSDWTLVFNDTSYLIGSIYFDSTNKVLYAGQGGPGFTSIYRCDTTTLCNQTSDWTLAYDDGTNQAHSFTYDSNNNLLYVGMSSSDIYRCDTATLCDQTSDWTLEYSGAGSGIFSLLFDFNNNALYAGQGNSAPFGDIIQRSSSFTSRFCIDSADFNDCLVNGTGMIDEPSTSALAAAPGPGDSETENATWTATVGPHDVFFCADVTDVVTESNENNNCSSTSFTVSAPSPPPPSGEPDLVVLGVQNNSVAQENVNITFSGDIQNVGDAVATAYWEVSSMSLLQTASLNSQGESELLPRGVVFKPDGTKMYYLGQTNDLIYEYDLLDPWDVSTANYIRSASTNSQGESEINPWGLAFSTDGTKMYYTGGDNDVVYEYDLSVAWNVSTANYIRSASLNSQGESEQTPYDLIFKPDGTKMYYVGSEQNQVYEYDLSTAWNVSSANYTQAASLNSQGEAEIVPQSIAFKSDGTKMYYLGSTNRQIYEYDLLNPWDVSTAIYVRAASVNAQGESETFPRGLEIKPDGTKIYYTGSSNTQVYEYNLGGPSTARFCVGPQGDFNEAECFNDAGPASMDVILPDPSTSALPAFVAPGIWETETSGSWLAGSAGNYDIMLCTDVGEVVAESDESLLSSNCTVATFTVSAPPAGPECSDSQDNLDPEDMLTDNLDPGCYDSGAYDALDDDETDTLPQCSNFFDDDGDGFTDYPADIGCTDAGDNDETNIVVSSEFNDLVSSQPIISTGGAVPFQDSAVEFVGDVTNEGTDRTPPGGFNNEFTVFVNYDPIGGTFDSTVTLGGAVVSGRINSGSSKTTSPSDPWTAIWQQSPLIDTHAVQLCADTPTPGLVDEGISGGELNNCGPLLVFNTQPAPPIPVITQDVNQTDQGDPYNISWSSTYANSCTITKQVPLSFPLPWNAGISGGPITESEFIIGDYIYEISCDGPGGNGITASVTHIVQPPSPPEAFISQFPNSGVQEDLVTVTWSSNFADSCIVEERYDDGTGWTPYAAVAWAGTTAGNQPLNLIPIGSYQWRNTCTNIVGPDAVAETFVHTVAAKPPVFDVAPTLINEGDSVDILWECFYSAWATGVNFSTGAGNPPVGGPLTENPIVTTDYQVSCENGSSGFATVDVREPLLIITADPRLIQPATTTLVSWSAQGVNSCTVSGPDGFDFSSGDISGGIIYSDDGETGILNGQSIYTLTCQTAAGTHTEKVIVNINPDYVEI